MTEFTSFELNSNYKSRISMVKFIVSIYENAINKWNELNYDEFRDLYPELGTIPSLENDNQRKLRIKRESEKYPLIKFIYKGGVVLRLLLYTLKSEYTIDLESKIVDSFDDYFKLSDNDFQILILPKHFENNKYSEYYEKIYNQMNIINYLILRDMCDLFNDKLIRNKYFDFFSKDFSVRENILKEYYLKYEQLLSKALPNKYNNLKHINYLILEKNTITPSKNLANMNNEIYNFEKKDQVLNKQSFLLNKTNLSKVIIPDIYPSTNPNVSEYNLHNLYGSENFIYNLRSQYKVNVTKIYNKGPFYVSFNSNIDISDKIHISLARIKLNFNIIFDEEIQQTSKNVLIEVGGEVIDVSISKENEMLKKIHTNLDYQEYDMPFGDETLKFNSYSLRGLITDLISALFFQTTEEIDNLGQGTYLDKSHGFFTPWQDSKYIKRLNRLLLLITLDLLQHIPISLLMKLYNILDKKLDLNNVIDLNKHIELLIDYLANTYKDVFPNENNGFIFTGSLSPGRDEIIYDSQKLSYPGNNSSFVSVKESFYEKFAYVKNKNSLCAFIYIIIKFITYYKIVYETDQAKLNEFIKKYKEFISQIKQILKKLIEIISQINDINFILYTIIL